MSQSAVQLMSAAVLGVDNGETILRIIGIVSLFIQTMEVSSIWACKKRSEC